jgi:hypothetical protein
MHLICHGDCINSSEKSDKAFNGCAVSVTDGLQMGWRDGGLAGCYHRWKGPISSTGAVPHRASGFRVKAALELWPPLHGL